MLKRKIKKLTKALQTIFRSGKNVKKLLVCKVCDKIEVEVAHDIAAVTCAYCVQQQVAPPPNYAPKEKSDKPRGWHFKAYFEHEGKVYSKGIEVTDSTEITKLKKDNNIVDISKTKSTKKKATKKKVVTKKKSSTKGKKK